MWPSRPKLRRCRARGHDQLVQACMGAAGGLVNRQGFPVPQSTGLWWGAQRTKVAPDTQRQRRLRGVAALRVCFAQWCSWQARSNGLVIQA